MLGFGCNNGWVNPFDSLDVKGLGFRVGEKGEQSVVVFVVLCYVIPSPYSLPKTYMKCFSFSICSQTNTLGMVCWVL